MQVQCLDYTIILYYINPENLFGLWGLGSRVAHFHLSCDTNLF